MADVYERSNIVEIQPSFIGNDAIIVLVGATVILLFNVFLCFRGKMLYSIGSSIKRTFPGLWTVIERCLLFFGVSLVEFNQNHNIPRHHAENCPLCLVEFTNQVYTNCGHLYCGKFVRSFRTFNIVCVGKCIIDFWEAKARQQIQCPLCRRSIMMLIKDFGEPVQANGQVGNPDPGTEYILKGIRHYNLLYSKRPRTVIPNRY